MHIRISGQETELVEFKEAKGIDQRIAAFDRSVVEFFIMQALENIGPEAMAAYRRTAGLRAAAHAERRRQRLRRGLEVARKAAALLRECFHVERVVIFGSLLRPEHFSEYSDADVAVWGLAEKDYLRAVAAVTALDPEITVDLIAVEQAPIHLRQRIEQEGKET